MRRSIQDVTNECLEMMKRGASLEDCLHRYPEHAVELDAILSAAIYVRESFARKMSHDVRTRVRARVMGNWGRRHTFLGRRFRVPFLMPKWVGVAALLLVTFLVGSVGTVAAAASAVPGDPLYPVKQLREETQIWFSLSPEAKVYMYSHLVKERVEELTRLAEAGDTGSGSIAVERLEKHVSGLERLVSEHEGGLQEAMMEAQASLLEAESTALGVIDENHGQTQVEIRHALSIIQVSKSRVQSALESLGW